MQEIAGKWLRVALINLSIVALLGVTLRYKIAFSLPFIDQANLHHGHSHFAFSGWISMSIMILLVHFLHKNGRENVFKRYGGVLFANLIVSYGMLLSFSIQGYAFSSTFFSILSIFVAYVFAILFWKDLNKLNVNQNCHLWFKAALFFNVISSLGVVVFACMMSAHFISQKVYLVSELFFLHFQYNGWFLFACMGIFISKLNELTGERKSLKYIFWLFALSCVPSFFLSALWLPIPYIIYILVVMSAVMQLTGWIWFLGIIRDCIRPLKKEMSNTAKWLMSLAAISLSLKLILQLGSTYLPLNRLVFGFRPIVIGYLHLVFLGVISTFILGFILSEKLLVANRIVIMGLLIFVSGIFINEILLMTQGVFALATETVPYMNELLFIAAIIMFTGTLCINIKQFPSTYLEK